MARKDAGAYAQGYDDGWFSRRMYTWREYTGGNPGYNGSWGSYKRGYEAGKKTRLEGKHPLEK